MDVSKASRRPRSQQRIGDGGRLGYSCQWNEHRSVKWSTLLRGVQRIWPSRVLRRYDVDRISSPCDFGRVGSSVGTDLPLISERISSKKPCRAQKLVTQQA